MNTKKPLRRQRNRAKEYNIYFIIARFLHRGKPPSELGLRPCGVGIQPLKSSPTFDKVSELE